MLDLKSEQKGSIKKAHFPLKKRSEMATAQEKRRKKMSAGAKKGRTPGV